MGFRSIPVHCLALDSLVKSVLPLLPEAEVKAFRDRSEAGASAASTLNKMLWFLQPMAIPGAGSLSGGGTPHPGSLPPPMAAAMQQQHLLMQQQQQQFNSGRRARTVTSEGGGMCDTAFPRPLQLPSHDVSYICGNSGSGGGLMRQQQQQQRPWDQSGMPRGVYAGSGFHVPAAHELVPYQSSGGMQQPHGPGFQEPIDFGFLLGLNL